MEHSLQEVQVPDIPVDIESPVDMSICMQRKTEYMIYLWILFCPRKRLMMMMMMVMMMKIIIIMNMIMINYDHDDNNYDDDVYITDDDE